MDLEQTNKKYIVKNKEKFIGELSGFQVVLLYLVKKDFTNEQINKLFRIKFNYDEDLDFIAMAEDKMKPLIDTYINFGKIDFNAIINIIDNMSDNIKINKIRSFLPREITISLTNSCPCSCSYCYAKSKDKDRIINLDSKTLNDTLKFCNDYGIKIINLTGGDPICYDHIDELFELLKKYDMKCNFSTKSIYNAKMDRILSNYSDYVESLQISLDSLYQEELDKMVKGISVDSMLETIEYISGLNLRFEFKVNSVLTKYNIDRILDLTLLLKDIGVDKHGFAPYTFSLGNNDSLLFATHDQFMNLLERIKTQDLNDFLIYPISIDNSTVERPENLCKIGLDGIIINYDGNVFLCERFCVDKKYSVGNIHDNTLEEIWSSKKINDFFNPSREKFFSTECYDCEEYEECVENKGICYINSLVLNGTVYSPDNFCHKISNRKRRIY